MTYTSVVAAMFDFDAFGADELPGWSHPAHSVVSNAVGLRVDFFASDDLPGWSRPSFTAAA
jgi:hypothetical protein